MIWAVHFLYDGVHITYAPQLSSVSSEPHLAASSTPLLLPPIFSFHHAQHRVALQIIQKPSNCIMFTVTSQLLTNYILKLTIISKMLHLLHYCPMQTTTAVSYITWMTIIIAKRDMLILCEQYQILFTQCTYTIVDNASVQNRV